MTESLGSIELEKSDLVVLEEMEPVQIDDSGQEKMGLRERFSRSRLGRTAISLAAATGILSGALAMEATPAVADGTMEYTVADDAVGGVYARESPHTGDTESVPGVGIYPGDVVRFICGVTNGEAVGPYANTTWHKLIDETRPNLGQFWENGHWFNDPSKPGELAPGEPNCDSIQAANIDGNTLQPAAEVPVFASFDRGAAEDWARAHATAKPPEGIDSCTWFASKALAAGGLPQDDIWNTGFVGVNRNGVRDGTDAAWIAPKLLEYLQGRPYIEIRPLGHMGPNNNDLPETKPGDLIAYVWHGDGLSTDISSIGRTEHISVVVGHDSRNPNYPTVAEWGNTKPTPYVERGWTWSVRSNGWLQNERNDRGVQDQRNMFAYLVHIRNEDELNIG